MSYRAFYTSRRANNSPPNGDCAGRHIGDLLEDSAYESTSLHSAHKKTGYETRFIYVPRIGVEPMSQVFQTCALNRVDHLGNTFFECGLAKLTFTTLSVVGPEGLEPPTYRM